MPNITYIEKVIATKPLGWSYSDPHEVFSFSFEEIDLLWWSDFVSHNWMAAIYVSIVYVVTIFSLQRWMRDRRAYELKVPLFLWNLSLGIFSILGFARTAPGFLYTLSKSNGFYSSICTKEDLNIPMAYWILLFILSKFWELGDTIFIVLRKRPLIFLQWYHHLVTMSVVWILAPLVEPIARWYTVLNYGVHSLMYPYFAFKAIGLKIPNRIANLITTLQLAQMIIGFTVNILSMYYQKTGQNCVRYDISIKMFAMVYGSFLILFGKLFYDSVIKSGRKLKEKQAKKID